MTPGRKGDQRPGRKTDNPFFIRVEAALKRAAVVAKRRALATTGSYPIYENGRVFYRTSFRDPEGDNCDATEDRGSPDGP